MSESNTITLPEVVVFAGPNGSGVTATSKCHNTVPLACL